MGMKRHRSPVEGREVRLHAALACAATALFVSVAVVPAEAATTSLVHRLRGGVLPRALAGTGVVAYTGGETASYIDLADRVGDRLPLLIAVGITNSGKTFPVAFSYCPSESKESYDFFFQSLKEEAFAGDIQSLKVVVGDQAGGFDRVA